MRKGMFGYFIVLCCGVLLAGGCAKKDVVKQDESVAPAQTAKAADDAAAREAAERAAREAAAREAAARKATEAPKESAVKEEAAKETRSAVKASEGDAALQSLSAVFFAFDSQALSQDSRDTLAKNADVLKKKTDLKIKIEGHCDERGSDEYNLALGERRAKSAMDYLVTMGVPANRIDTISYGKEKPADPGHDETAWAKNRRAEFTIVK
jgi:peptidoglycan-associated lipoprotein